MRPEPIKIAAKSSHQFNGNTIIGSIGEDAQVLVIDGTLTITGDIGSNSRVSLSSSRSKSDALPNEKSNNHTLTVLGNVQDEAKIDCQGDVIFEGYLFSGVSVTSHNGNIQTNDLDDGVRLLAHNGSINAGYVGKQCWIVSHHGKIKTGNVYSHTDIEAYDGEIEVGTLGANSSVKSHNGRVIAHSRHQSAKLKSPVEIQIGVIEKPALEAKFNPIERTADIANRIKSIILGITNDGSRRKAEIEILALIQNKSELFLIDLDYLEINVHQYYALFENTLFANNFAVKNWHYSHNEGQTHDYRPVDICLESFSDLLFNAKFKEAISFLKDKPHLINVSHKSPNGTNLSILMLAMCMGHKIYDRLPINIEAEYHAYKSPLDEFCKMLHVLNFDFTKSYTVVCQDKKYSLTPISYALYMSFYHPIKTLAYYGSPLHGRDMDEVLEMKQKELSHEFLSDCAKQELRVYEIAILNESRLWGAICLAAKVPEHNIPPEIISYILSFVISHQATESERLTIEKQSTRLYNSALWMSQEHHKRLSTISSNTDGICKVSELSSIDARAN